jgi:gas vesicle protein
MARLSEQLAELSRRAKAAEDAADAARAETREKLAARVDQARTNAERRANELGDTSDALAQDASDRWSEIQGRWRDHVSAMRVQVQERQVERDAKRAERRAEAAEDDAAYAISFAISFAISAVEEAEYAVLDATLARADADAAGVGT